MEENFCNSKADDNGVSVDEKPNIKIIQWKWHLSHQNSIDLLGGKCQSSSKRKPDVELVSSDEKPAIKIEDDVETEDARISSGEDNSANVNSTLATESSDGCNMRCYTSAKSNMNNNEFVNTKHTECDTTHQNFDPPMPARQSEWTSECRGTTAPAVHSEPASEELVCMRSIYVKQELNGGGMDHTQSDPAAQDRGSIKGEEPCILALKASVSTYSSAKDKQQHKDDGHAGTMQPSEAEVTSQEEGKIKLEAFPFSESMEMAQNHVNDFTSTMKMEPRDDDIVETLSQLPPEESAEEIREQPDNERGWVCDGQVASRSMGVAQRETAKHCKGTSTQGEDVIRKRSETQRQMKGSKKKMESSRVKTGPDIFLLIRASRGNRCKKLHRCDMCAKVFARRYDLSLHVRRHAGEKPFACGFCVKRFVSRTILTVHMRVHTGERPHCCATCGKRFANSKGLSQHQITHSELRAHACGLCGQRFARRADRLVHEKRHTGEKPFECDECDRRFIKMSALTDHKRTHTGERPFSCDVCSKAFVRSYELTSHARTHLSVRPYRCDVCQKSFVKLQNLISHQRIHTGEKPFPCDVCGKCFTNGRNLTEHKRTHTGERPYACEVCGQTFARRSCFVDHKSKHSPVKERQYGCDKCEKKYASVRGLNYHKQTHTAQRLYKCELCEKSFVLGSTLYHHRQTHLSEKPLSCDVCGKGFLWRRDLDSHRRTHSGERPFKCDACDKSFTRSSVLNEHKRSHLNEKPFECDQCDGRFATRGNLNRHKKIHSQEKKWFNCDVCEKKFFTLSNLKRHKKIHLRGLTDLCDDTLCSDSMINVAVA